jgi:hypothetical protein
MKIEILRNFSVIFSILYFFRAEKNASFYNINSRWTRVVNNRSVTT